MKKYDSITYILSLACACLILAGCATSQPGSSAAPVSTSARSTSGGHLLVYRVANFGSNLRVSVATRSAGGTPVPLPEHTPQPSLGLWSIAFLCKLNVATIPYNVAACAS
jgi:hypothetical protein